jgi:hypothetical protein
MFSLQLYDQKFMFCLHLFEQTTNTKFNGNVFHSFEDEYTKMTSALRVHFT